MTQHGYHPAPKVIGKVELLFEKALAGIVKEMKASLKSMEKIMQDTLEVLWETLSQTTALVDLVELARQICASVKSRSVLSRPGTSHQ